MTESRARSVRTKATDTNTARSSAFTVTCEGTLVLCYLAQVMLNPALPLQFFWHSPVCLHFSDFSQTFCVAVRSAPKTDILPMTKSLSALRILSCSSLRRTC